MASSSARLLHIKEFLPKQTYIKTHVTLKKKLQIPKLKSTQIWTTVSIKIQKLIITINVYITEFYHALNSVSTENIIFCVCFFVDDQKTSNMYTERKKNIDS